MSQDEYKQLLIKCETLRTELTDLDMRYSSLMLESEAWTEATYLEQALIDEGYNDNLTKYILKLKSKILNVSSSNSNTSNSNNSNNKGILPHIELPTFDGKPESYNKFITSFENIFSNYKLSSCEKFSLLSKQLSGPAKKIIESLSVNNLDYDSAKTLLNEAFSNKLNQQYSVINSLCNLKLNSNAIDAFSWIGDARILEEQVRSLSIDSDIFVQYFLWNSLNDDFKKHLTAITNKTRPSLEEIVKGMFEANSRYIEDQKSKNIAFVSVANAVSVKISDGTFSCSLCRNDKESR